MAEYVIVNNETESISTLIGEQIKGNFRSIRVSISINGFKKSDSSIGIILEGDTNESFFQAHEIFNPNIVLSILMGEIPPHEARELVMLSLNNANQKSSL